MERGQAIRVDMNALFKLEYNGDLEALLHKYDPALLAMINEPGLDMLLALVQDQLRK